LPPLPCAASGAVRLRRIQSGPPGESDLDFLVEFDPLPPGAYTDAYFGLLEALQSLSGRPVDLVVGSAIKNPYFRQSVELTKMLLYAS